MVAKTDQTIVEKSVAKVFLGSSFKTIVEQAMDSMVLEPHVVDAIATCIIHFPAATASAATFVKNVDEKCFL